MIIYEIERKFLVKISPKLLTEKDYTMIYQKYFLSNNFLQFRIRREEDIYFTGDVKKKATQRIFIMCKLRFSKPIEVAVELNFLPLFIKNKLKTLTNPLKNKTLVKKRYFFGKWMLDFFITKNLPIKTNSILEIELSKKNEPLPDFPEGIKVIKEITNNEELYNHNLYKNI